MVETSEYLQESKNYENTLSSDFKKNNGIFYTDVSLVNLMFNQIEFSNKLDLKVIDPTCGTGIFMSVALLNGYSNVYGADIDKGAIKVASDHIKGANLKVFDTISNSVSEVLNKFKIKEKFDLVIGNPPYAPLCNDTLINTDDYLFLRNVKSCGDNLFIAALLRAKELVKDGGIISYIIPKNFLHVTSYSLLRRELLRDFSILSIVDIGSYFKKVRGEQIILTIKKNRNLGNEIHIKKLVNNNFELLTVIPQTYFTDEILLFNSHADYTIYRKFQNTYSTLNDYVRGYVGRGKSKNDNSVSGKDIRKFGLKSGKKLVEGNQIFIQNIYSAESGIIACFGGKEEASETVTVFTDGDPTMCRYVLGVIHSRLCNFFLYKYCYNNSKLTMHVDSKYLRKIPFKVDNENFDIVLEFVDMLETLEYMTERWFEYYERLNRIIYRIYDISEEEVKYIDSEMKFIQSRKWVTYE